MRAICAAGVVLLGTVAGAWAQQLPAMHDKAWYQAHTAARLATLKWCHADATHADLFDCQNAEAAQSLNIGRNTTPDQILRNPSYWVQNPIARAGAMAQCRSRAPGTELVWPYCGVIGQADALAARR